MGQTSENSAAKMLDTNDLIGNIRKMLTDRNRLIAEKIDAFGKAGADRDQLLTEIVKLDGECGVLERLEARFDEMPDTRVPDDDQP